MKYIKYDVDGIAVVKVNLVKATIENAAEFKEFIFRVIENNKQNKIIINFEEVCFVDSSFLGALVEGLKKINEFKGDIKITGLHSSVRLMFELTRLYKVFEIFDNKNDAILSF